MWKLLKAREIAQSPFSSRDQDQRAGALGPARPRRAGEFTEWTADDKLRHPVYLGLRDDKRAADVVREEPRAGRGGPRASQSKAVARCRCRPDRRSSRSSSALEDARRDGTVDASGRQAARRHQSREGVLAGGEDHQGRSAALLRAGRAADPAGGRRPAAGDEAVSQRRRRHGVLPAAIAPGEAAAGVRIETLPRAGPDLRARRAPLRRRRADDAAVHDAARRHLAGPVVLARRSRRSTPTTSRSISIPATTRRSTRVLDVARWVRDELDVAARARRAEDVGRRAGCTSTFRCRRTRRTKRACCSARSSRRSSQRAIRRVATVERTVRARPRGTVYVDFLQNILGKTLATAYSARASDFAGVSTPLHVGGSSTTGSIRSDFTIGRRRRDSARSAICGRGCVRRSLRIWKTVFRKYQARQDGARKATTAAARRARPRSGRRRLAVRSRTCAWPARGGRRSTCRSGSAGRRHRRRSRRASQSAAAHPPHSNATTCRPARRAASTSYGVSPSITACSGAQPVDCKAAWTMSGSGFDFDASSEDVRCRDEILDPGDVRAAGPVLPPWRSSPPRS